MLKRTTSWFLGTLLCACGGTALDGGPPQDSGPEREMIVGGVKDTGDPAIVALFAAPPGQTKGALCTAEIIAPTVVMTAAHCVLPAEVGQNAVFTVLLGADLTDKNHPSPKVAVKETHYDPLFDITNVTNGHDIAVAILAAPVSITPLPFNRTPLTQGLVNQRARLVGYGLNDGFAQTGAGIKRTATVKLNSFDDKLVHTGTLFQRICNGDSGGPVLMNLNGQETIVGVNSFGFIFCLGDGSSTRVDDYTSFLDPYLQ